MHINNSDDDEMNPLAYNIWTSGVLQTPNILKTILTPNGPEPDHYSEDLFCLDTSSTSQKRKLLECDKEEFEERFHKVQLKRKLQKVAARASLVVDDKEDSDDEDTIYQQMDWIEKENMLSSDSSDEDSSLDEEQESDLLILPRSKWKDERRKLLRISMAKIQCVDDPEAYLRRSVLINNTVRRLRIDASNNPSASAQGNASYESDVTECKDQSEPDTFNFTYQYDYTENSNDVESYNFSLNCYEVPSLNIHLALNSNKSLDTLQHKILYSGPSFCDRSSLDDQRLNDISVPSLVLKQSTPVHLFSTQPCGLEYRSPMLLEDGNDEYHESSSPSILNSVVYHSLIASLET